MVTTLVFFLTFVYMIVIKWLRETVKLDEHQYDVDTVTPSDFTVELDINSKMRKIFDKMYE